MAKALTKNEPATVTIDTGTEIYNGLMKAKAQIMRMIGGDEKVTQRFIRAAHQFYLRGDDDVRAAEPRSFLTACMDAAIDGLQPDGVDGWIVVRKRIATWTPSWRGLLKIARRCADISGFSAEVIYRQEIERGGFEVDNAIKVIKHRPWPMLGVRDEPTDDDIVGAFAVCVVTDDRGNRSREFRVVWRHELDQAAAMSGNPYDPTPSKPWIKHYAAMCRKTAVRRLMDWLPLPDDVLDVVARDDARASDQAAGRVVFDAAADAQTPVQSLAQKVADRKPELAAGDREPGDDREPEHDPRTGEVAP